MLFFELYEIGRDLSMMKIANKLAKRTKTEKFEKN